VSKEKTSYEREVVSNENKLEKMIQEGKDEYDIKKQVVILYHGVLHSLDTFTIR